MKATYEWDFKGAEKECDQAIDLDPNDPLAHREMAFFRSAFGRENEALREIDAAILLAPTSFNKRSRGMILYYSRRYDEAIEQFRRVEETDPSEYDTRRWLMNAYEMKKDYVNALETRIRQMQFAEATPAEIAAVKAVYAESGWPGVLRTLEDSTRPTFDGAANFAQLGDNVRAFDTLENILDRRAIMLIHLAREPRFDPIRNDPRFDLLLKRIGLK
jgi:tetratricopeptide (TPR) repeat protein